MNAIFFAFLASSSAALANLFFRKNSQQSQDTSNTNGYLVFFYLISFCLSFVLYPDILNVSWDLVMMGVGMCVGILNVALMRLTSHALQQGPAGLTFAFQNTSAVFPGMILFLVFGEEYGFTYSYMQLIGIVLVVYGLFLGAKGESSSRPGAMFQWLKYALACLGIQVLALTLIQARCEILGCTPASATNTSGSLASKDDICFMLGQFGAAFLFQAIYLLSQKIYWPKKGAFYGSLGGVANFASTFMLLLATKWALPFEKGILFPCFAVGTIIICNLWANRLYGEKFNFASNMTCASGIMMGLMA